jgi:uncharacterized membrane protein
MLNREGVIEILDAAVLVKDRDGKTSVKETEDVDAVHGALFGAIVGGLIGLLAGPGGAIMGAASGAATGGLAAFTIDMGLPDNFLSVLQQRLKPGYSAVVALIEHRWAETVIEALVRSGGKPFEEVPGNELAARLTFVAEEKN